MMLPLYIFALIYLLFLCIFAILAFINIQHIIGTGSITIVSSFVTVLFCAFTAVILFYTWYLLSTTDWQELITIWNSEWIQNLFSNISLP